MSVTGDSELEDGLSDISSMVHFIIYNLSSFTEFWQSSPLVTNVFSIPYLLSDSTFILRDTGCIFHFSIQIMKANRKAPDGTPRFAVSHLGLFCLPMSHKKDTRLIWVKHTRSMISAFVQRSLRCALNG